MTFIIYYSEDERPWENVKQVYYNIFSHPQTLTDVGPVPNYVNMLVHLSLLLLHLFIVQCHGFTHKYRIGSPDHYRRPAHHQSRFNTTLARLKMDPSPLSVYYAIFCVNFFLLLNNHFKTTIVIKITNKTCLDEINFRKIIIYTISKYKKPCACLLQKRKRKKDLIMKKMSPFF